MRTFLLVGFLFLASLLNAGTTITPNTTLATETANNTSAADSFAGESNGNVAAGNISKVPTRSLLYTGATTKIYAHLMPWFGTSSHVSVGYDSADAAQAAKQVQDMVSRGMDGTIIDWYGQLKTHHNTASLNILHAAEQYSGFEVALIEDVGAVADYASPEQKAIDDLNYAYTAFMQSSAYMRRNGRPVVFFFGFETISVNMQTIKSALSWNPIFVYRNSGAFTDSTAEGGFAWLAPQTANYDTYTGLSYLDNFYNTALSHTSYITFGSGFKGFNDTIASWAPAGGRHINQFCGATWLNSMGEASKYYSASNQLENLQVVTWNDYEEGSAIESGIDNCIAVSANVSGNLLKWTITGVENTIDHYVVFISQDGQNLMSLSTVNTGVGQLDLSQYGFGAGSYTLYVKAVGRPSMTNKMSAAVSYTVTASTSGGGSTGTPAPAASADYAMTLASNAMSLKQGSSAAVALTVSSVNAAFNSTVSLQCQNLPANLTCTFSPIAVVPGTSGSTSTLTITAATQTGLRRPANAFGWMLVPAFGLMFGGIERLRRKKVVALLLVVVSLSIVLMLISCSGTTSSGMATSTQSTSTGTSGTGTTGTGTGTSSTSYTVTIAATSGSTVHTTTATVTVQ